MIQKASYFEEYPLWYKDAIIYELHVKTFYDSKGDGMGDFKGLTQKLNYLKDLGVTVLWLLPFYPSPLKDDGYDIADYFEIHPHYGTLKEFKEFLNEAHRRDIRVITELVINHTSDQHKWFQMARKAKPGSKRRNLYVWSNTPEKYKEVRTIFKDFETSNWAWDPVARAYYWHRFYSHQPDLNYDSPIIRQAILKIVDYWFDMGVDGFRLDAIPYLFEREGTSCESLPETYEFLKRLRAHIDGKFFNRVLLAEANQWPEDAVTYFGKGDLCHMAFHFPLMPRIFMAVRMEDRFPIVDILDQTPVIPETCQWALFLRNHDELTLEMVTDEERDYMYQMYARDPNARINLGIRRRLAPLLENDRRKIELMNVLLFSLPGTPIIYYGDEIGMGDNYYLGDRNGVRTPMQWSADRNAGFSRANPQKLYLPIIIDPEYHYEAVNVENQERNQASLLWWMKQSIAMRKHFKAFGRGSAKFLFPDNPKVLAFIRQYKDENILVAINLSKHSQIAELDLSQFSGSVLEEVFSRNRFPVIKKDAPYPLTFGPYGYYWFSIRKEEKTVGIVGERILPELTVHKNWERVLEGNTKEKLEEDILPSYLKGCRWFGGKGYTIQRLQISGTISAEKDSFLALLLFLEVQYTESLSETYFLPLSFATSEKAKEIWEAFPSRVLARLKVGNAEGILYDSLYDKAFHQLLLGMISRKHKIKGSQGMLITYPGKTFKKLVEIPLTVSLLDSQFLKTERSNTSILYGNTLFLKIFRRLEEGPNPDMEIGKFLTERTSYPYIPSFAGSIEYRKSKSDPVVIGLLEGFVPNQGDAWKFTLEAVERFIGRVLSRRNELQPEMNEIPGSTASHLEVAFQEIPLLLQELILGIYFEMAKLLGKRTAEMHLALASDTEDPNFIPEPFSIPYQKSLYQSMRSSAKRVLQLLKKNLKTLPEKARKQAEEILSLEREIVNHFSAILQKKLSVTKIRIHGDYRLEKILYTGKDFVIIDFEGESTKSLSDRRLKRSPLRDVAGMLRSVNYAAHTALFNHSSLRPEDIPVLEPWIDSWCKYLGGAFLRSYLDTAGSSPFIPNNREELDRMLRVYLLEKTISELGYELNNRLDWVMIPLRGIKHLLNDYREIIPNY
jgi:maltose alpha-D-glucosyltransferase/alpha-amylase